MVECKYVVEVFGCKFDVKVIGVVGVLNGVLLVVK